MAKCSSCGKEFTPRDPSHRKCAQCHFGDAPGGQRPGAPPRAGGGGGRLPESYLRAGYFDEKGNLRPELVTQHADQVAKALADAGVTTGQIRRFFTMARSIEQRLDSSGDFAAVVAEIASLQPFAASVIGREQSEQKRRDLEVFRQFIDRNAATATKDEKSFRKGFLPHFQSVVAYFTLYKPKER